MRAGAPRCRPALTLMRATRSPLELPGEREDIVLVSRRCSRRCSTTRSSSAWPSDVALGPARRRRALVRLHRRQPAQPRRARRAAARACARCSRRAACSSGASRWRRRSRARCAACIRRSTLCSTRCRCCAPIVLAGSRNPDACSLNPSCPLRCPRSARKRSPRSSTRCAPAGSRPARRRSGSRATSPRSSATPRCTASPSTRPPPACTWRSRRSGIGPGDEVITTTHTFTATAEVVRYLGADVVLVDIDPATLNIDPRSVEAAITPRTKAIMPVHYGGLAADMPAHARDRAAPRPEGGRGRRARAADHERRRAGRHAGQRRHGLQLLRQQDHHHRRGRHARHARRRRWPSARG